MLIVEEFPFKQKPYFDASGEAVSYLTQPYVRVQLTSNHKISPTPVNCLVDSGADRNLFPAQWGEVIGMPVRKGKKRTYVNFSFEQQVPLLGRTGFFNYFQEILFDEQNEKLVLMFNKTSR